MCLIAYGKTEKLLSLPLAAAWAQNDHGAGIILVNKGNQEVIKGIMKFPKLMDLLRSLEPSQRIVLHLRQATHGGVNPKNTHPFKIDESSWLAHNGILNGLGSYGEKGMSDSAHLARILSQLTHCDRLALLRTLTGRFAYVNKGKIHLVGSYEQRQGVQLSNSYWHPECQVESVVAPYGTPGFAFATSNYRATNYRWRNNATTLAAQENDNDDELTAAEMVENRSALLWPNALGAEDPETDPTMEEINRVVTEQIEKIDETI